MGRETTASGDYSTAMGRETTAASYAEVVLGQFNEVDNNASQTLWSADDAILRVGVGTASDQRKDALTVYKDGRVVIDDLRTNGGRRLDQDKLDSLERDLSSLKAEHEQALAALKAEREQDKQALAALMEEVKQLATAVLPAKKGGSQ